jgi:uncharacterized membrane protein
MIKRTMLLALSMAVFIANAAELEISNAYRSAFVRGETNAEFRVKIKNTGKRQLDNLELSATQMLNGEKAVKSTLHKVAKLEAGSETELAIPVETRLAPKWRDMVFKVSATAADGSVVDEQSRLAYGIGLYTLLV